MLKFKRPSTKLSTTTGSSGGGQRSTSSSSYPSSGSFTKMVMMHAVIACILMGGLVVWALAAEDPGTRTQPEQQQQQQQSEPKQPTTKQEPGPGPGPGSGSGSKMENSNLKHSNISHKNMNDDLLMDVEDVPADSYRLQQQQQQPHHHHYHPSSSTTTNNNNNQHHQHHQSPKPFNTIPYTRSSFKFNRIKSGHNFHAINSTTNAKHLNVNVNMNNVNNGTGQNLVVGELNNIGAYWLHPPTMMLRSARIHRSRRLTHAYNDDYKNKPPPLSSSVSDTSAYQTVQHQPQRQYSYSYSTIKTKPLKLLSLYSPSSSSASASLNSYFNNFHPHSSSSSSSSSSAVASVSSAAAAASSASAAAAAASQAVAVSGQQNRLKILLNPPPAGFGGALIPNKKCNFELYPSGCFDENGSICDQDGQCQCRPGYTIRIANLYCLRPSFIGEACYTTEQCEHKVINSGCFNYREEYREENPSAFFGPSQSIWPMGECRCRIGHRFDPQSNACVRSIIGSWCSNVWDCEMADEEQQQQQQQQHIELFGGHRSNRTHSPNSANLNLHGQQQQQHINSPLHLASTSRTKITNLVCEKNTCNCSQYFYYNQTAEECQYFETFGHTCESPEGPRPSSTATGNAPSATSSSSSQAYNPSKRSVRFRSRRNRLAKSILAEMAETLNPSSSSANSYRESGGEYEPLSSLNSLRLSSGQSVLGARIQDSVCNYPTVCTVNKTCGCADGYEHQPNMVPQCQRIGGGGPGAHYTHYFHSGSSIRSGMKGQDYPHDRSSMYHEGSSNVANFFEYVLYFLVPGLIIIFTFKPCFRRIGEWRNHMHQYQSDSDFYLATTANGRPVLAEMSVIGPQCAQVDKAGQSQTVAAAAAAAGPGTATTILSSVNNPHLLHHPPPSSASAAPSPMSTVGDVYSNEFASFAAFAPHLVYHNAYLFDTTDPCYATPIGYGCHPPLMATSIPTASMVGVGSSQPLLHQQQQSSMALVREKLQTIEESEQSEDGCSANTTINNFPMNPASGTTIIPTNVVGCVDCSVQQHSMKSADGTMQPTDLMDNGHPADQNEKEADDHHEPEPEAEATATDAMETVDNSQEEIGDKLTTSSTATTTITTTTQVDNGDDRSNDDQDVADST